MTATATQRDILIPIGDASLGASLVLPQTATGMVAFAHGSGSSRFSSRNRYVAGVLNEAGLATLLLDLLTADEAAIDEDTRALRFDIDLLSRRMTDSIDWLADQERLGALPLGLFGASTGAAAALNAAAQRPRRVAAVVSRGGRPDLAPAALPLVRCPVLLVVGGRDHSVLDLNRQAAARLTSPREVHVVAGATHLFEEPGTLEAAAGQARDWFLRFLRDHEEP